MLEQLYPSVSRQQNTESTLAYRWFGALKWLIQALLEKC